MLTDNSIDYSASRKKSVMMVKKIQEREERLSQMIKKQRQSTTPGDIDRKNFTQFQSAKDVAKSPFGKT